MNTIDNEFSATYLNLSFHLSEILTDEEYDEKLFEKLALAWNKLELPDDKGNLTTEVQLLNARLILLFFDSEFRKDLKETITAYGSLFNNQQSSLIKLEKLDLQFLTSFMQDENLDLARMRGTKLRENWAITFDYGIDNVCTLSSFNYGITDFNLELHNRKLCTTLKSHPDISPELVSEMSFDIGERHLLAVDLRYGLETNLKLFERKLRALYEREDSEPKRTNTQTECNKRAEEKFFSPHRISNLFSVQPQHRHFDIHLRGLTMTLTNSNAKAETVARAICDQMSPEGTTVEVNSIAKIIKDLPLITRPFHHELAITRTMIY